MIKDIVTFIRKPDLFSTSLKWYKRLFVLLKVYLVATILVVIISYINNLLIKHGVYNGFRPTNAFIFNQAVVPFKHYFKFLLVMIPIYEETTFRLLLTKFNKHNIIISCSLYIGWVIYILIYRLLWQPNIHILTEIIPFLYLLFVSIIPYFFFYKLIGYLINKSNIEVKWNTNFPKVFYSSTILFLVYHIPSFDISFGNLIFIPFLFIPLLVYAIGLAYIRVRCGIAYSILLHILFLIPRYLFV